ncbi:hypothetical protein [Streptomyces sp. NPDC047108]|uniref:hypothetical protein n=1 Tax=Streptomyces sp. NPDC047108 TaxID=3155025 RepID=UPI0033F60C3F
MEPVLSSAPDELVRQQFTAQLAAARQLMLALAEVGTVHCSLGLHRNDVDDTDDEGGRPLFSLFTLSWRDTSWAPRHITAARAATVENHTHVEYFDLPCGPASISETVRTAAAGSGFPQEPLLQVFAHLPHPDGKRLAVLTLSTSAVRHREQYRSILRQIAELVSFENPLTGT